MCNKILMTQGVFSGYTSDGTHQTIRLTVTGEEGFSWSAVISTPCEGMITTLALRKFRSEHKGVNVTFTEKVVPDAERDALISNDEMMNLLEG